MIKKGEFSVTNIEEKLFKWARKRRHQIFTLLLYGSFLAAFSALPYFNLLVNKSTFLVLAVVLALIIFKISIKKIAAFSLLLVLIGMPLILLERYETAELLSNFAYGLLFLGLVRSIISNDPD